MEPLDSQPQGCAHRCSRSPRRPLFLTLALQFLTLSRFGRGKGEGKKTGAGKKATLQTCLLFATVVLIAAIAQGAESPYKIRIGFPSLAFSYMPYYVAQEKGIYKKYGIESEYIQMTSAIQPQAVVAGNINYFTSVSTGISAAIAGLPLVILMNFCDVSPWVLVTHKDINKPQDLIGKTVALSGVRTSPYYYFQAFVKKSELNDKDVGTINTGGTAEWSGAAVNRANLRFSPGSRFRPSRP